MDMVKKRVAELEGAQLDWAVAMAGEEWKTAHRFYPTMTLDPRFKGVEIQEGDDYEKRCFLLPNNPMRQVPQLFCPSKEWEHGGPIIERERIGVSYSYSSVYGAGYWVCMVPRGEYADICTGQTPLIAAMRAFVASKLGDEVEVPV